MLLPDVDPMRLPVELEREIFEIAARAFPQTIPAIVLVARRFRTWFEPELYRIIRSGEDGKVIPPLYMDSDGTILTESCQTSVTTLNVQHIQRFGPSVRHIILQRRGSDEIEKILEYCPNVRNLAIWIIKGSCKKLNTLLNEHLVHLKRLSLDPSYFFENYASDFSIPFDQPMFHRLSHLEIINATSSWSKWRQLALLPCLTHLALAGVTNQKFIDQVLEECEQLQIFVVFYTHLGFLTGEVTIPQKDVRVVLLQSVSDHLDHWERGARGKEDFWIIAEKCKQDALFRAIELG